MFDDDFFLFVMLSDFDPPRGWKAYTVYTILFIVIVTLLIVLL